MELDPSARRDMIEIFDTLEVVADQQQNHLLLMTVAALRDVHALFPGADALNMRGTHEQTTRILIHNTIANVFNPVLAAVSPARSATTPTRASDSNRPSDEEPTPGPV